ncbi:MAG: tetratricopeptide repeat protein [Xanthomonadales bacterium]|nr:tetratricopeptide repeat protein [Xanthomonadales bacterium]
MRRKRSHQTKKNMLREAIEHHRQGRLGEAETAYREALAANSSDAEAMRGLAVVRRACGDLGESAELITKAHELQPEQPNLLLMLGSVRFEQGDVEASRKAYELALTLDPNLAGAHTAIGHMVMMQGNPALAEQHFRTALRVEEDPQALNGLGTLALNRGDAETGIKYFTRAADLAPNDAPIAFGLGRAFAARNMLAFAEQALRKALRLKPGMPQANGALGQLLIQDKRVAEAEPFFQALSGIAGFELAHALGLGDVARMQERFEDAVGFYERALAVRPEHEACFEAMLWSLGKLGRGEQLLALLDQRIADFPEQPRWRATRARIQSSSGHPAKAVADWQRLREIEPQNPEVAVELVRAYGRNGDFDLASELAEASVVLAAGNPELTLVRARARMRKGENEAARELLSTINLTRLDQDLTRSYHHVSGLLNDREGHFEEAVRCFREAQNGLPGSLPMLETLPTDFHYQTAVAQPQGEAWKHAPILLIGAPGSGVERIAALLADQTGVNVLRDRVQGLRNDCFDTAAVDLGVEHTPAAEIEAHREAYLASMRGHLDLDKPLIDWIPRFYAQYLLVAHRIMPGTKVILVDRDARDCLLGWLAFGWLPYAGLNDFDRCVEWLGRALAHVRLVDELGGLPHLVVNAEQVLADPAGAGAELARFVGIDALVPGNLSVRVDQGAGGLPARFADGHWQDYTNALAAAFALLPVKA